MAYGTLQASLVRDTPETLDGRPFDGSDAIVGLGRRLRPEYRVARQRMRGLRRRARELKDPASAHKRLEQEIRKLDDAAAKENATADQRIQALQTDLRDGLARITMELNRRTAQVQQRIAGLPAKEQSLIAKALEPTVRAHIGAKLRARGFFDPTGTQWLSSETVNRLWKTGVSERSADSCQFSPVTVDRVEVARVAAQREVRRLDSLPTKVEGSAGCWAVSNRASTVCW